MTGLPEIGPVEHERAGLGELGSDLAAGIGRDGAHVDVDAAPGQAGQDAVGSQRHGPHGLRVCDDGDDHLGGSGHGPRGVGPAHALLDQRRRLVARPVPARHAVTGGQQAGHDQLAHGAKADEPDLHATSPSCRSADPAAKSTMSRRITSQRTLPYLGRAKSGLLPPTFVIAALPAPAKAGVAAIQREAGSGASVRLDAGDTGLRRCRQAPA